MSLDDKTLGQARFDFADQADVDLFVTMLDKFERGDIGPDEWRSFRLLHGAYGQRQTADISMLRVKLPQGIVTSAQLVALADVAEKHSRGFGHITTRQNMQMHFVKLSEMEQAMRTLAEAGITCREACGNSVRNVCASPTSGLAADEVFDPVPYAEAFTRHFLRHPLASTLPRKFKVAFAGGGADHAFALVNDLGFVARTRTVADDASPGGQRTERGFRLTVAGGTAILCRSGELLFDFLPAGEILGVAEAVLQVFHDHGDRKHRHKNRLKFLVKQLGWERFREMVHVELAIIRERGLPPLPFDPETPPESAEPPVARKSPPSPAELRALIGADPTIGPGIQPRFLPVAGDPRGDRFVASNVVPQRQAGYATVTIVLPLGDISSGRMRALARIAESHGDGTLRTTHGQNLVLTWVRESDVRELHALLGVIGLDEPDPETLADVSSCPGAETCKLAVTQSRGAAELLSNRFRLDRELVDRARGLVVKVSGCPNGCGLHHVAGIGLQGGMRKVEGRAVPQYFVYAGGDPGAEPARFGRVIAKVPARRVEQVFERLIELYEAKREPGESITAYLGRAPLAELKAPLADLEKLDESSASPDDYIDLGETQAYAPETSEGECAA